MLNTEMIERFFSECDFKYLVEDNIEQNIINKLPLDIPFFYETGATKLTIIFDDEPFVLKIPFDGLSDYWDSSLNTIYFKCGGGKNHTDYCALEKDVYSKIKKFYPQVLPLFAETRYVTTIKKRPIYCQPYVFPCGNFKSMINVKNAATSLKAVSKAREKTLFCDMLTDFWLAMVVEKYGEAILYDFLAAVDDFDINDLDGNVGVDYGGNPIVFDYSGYHEG